MKKLYLILSLSIVISFSTKSQIVTHPDGEIEIPNVTQSDGPLGLGSLLWLSSGTTSTAIQENWGINLSGELLRPVKIYNASLLVGYTSNNQSFGAGNLFVNGNVGIGTTNPGSYKLAVNGSIHTQGVHVDMTGWSDYVFDPEYHLQPLSFLKSYIVQNRHLPEIPSEEEVIKQGIDLGEMNKLLTKKIEELTLYLIGKDKEIQQLQKQAAKSAKQGEDIEELKKQLKELLKNNH